MKQGFNLLKTKLFLPAANEAYVNRESVICLLEKGLKGRLTYIHAPTGFGKSSAVSHWLRSSQLKASWYTLDKNDNNLNIFLSYFITAIQNIKPGTGSEILTILQTGEKHQVEYIASSLINEIAEANEPFIFILDDFHNIESKDIFAFLNFFLLHLPDNFHLYICSRYHPDNLPVSKLHLQNKINILNIEGLKFNTKDIKNLLIKNKIQFSEKIVGELLDNTEGWALGLQLFIHSLKENIITGNDLLNRNNKKYIFEYLFDEVIAKQEERIQDFLAKTSVLHEFTTELTDCLPGIQNSGQIIQELLQKNLFIIPLDNNEEWFRYHHLFAELLLKRLEKNYSDESIRNLHLKTAEWYAQNDFSNEAVPHALQAGEFSYAAALMEKVVPKMDSRGEIATLLNWFEKLPQEIIFSNATLFNYYCCSLIQSGFFDKAVRKTEEISERLEGFNERDKAVIRASANNVMAVKAFLQGDIPLMKKLAMSAVSLKHGDNFVSASSHANFALACLKTGNEEEAIKHYKESIRCNLAIENYLPALRSEYNLAGVYLKQGNLPAAKACMQEITEKAKLYGLARHPLIAVVLKDMALISYYMDNTEDFDMYSGRAVNLAENMSERFLISITVAHLLLNSDRYEEAKNIEQGLTHIDIKTGLQKQLYDSLKIKLLLAEDNEKEAEKTVIKNVNPEIFFLVTSVTEYHISRHNYKAALAVINGAAGKITAFPEKIEAELLMVKTEYLAGETGKAVQRLKHALLWPESVNFISLFYDIAHECGELLIKTVNSLLTEGKDNPFYFLLLQRFPVSGKAENNNAELLTERENEILELLAKDMSYQEISDKLYISKNTLKTHIKSLYRKIDVSNRTLAMMYYKEVRGK